MLNAEWKAFRSGTDIRGCAMEGAAGEPVTLTDQAVERMASGFLLWLSERRGCAAGELTVSVGRDSRLSGPRIRDAVVHALTAGGAHVLDCGMASTPAMFMTTVDLGCDGAVQITASHHPWQRNGLKFFVPEGGLEGADIEAILTHAQESAAPPAAAGRVEEVEYMSRYAARLRTLIVEGVGAGERPLDGFHIVVDAGNGAGGFYAGQVLEPLGAEVTGSQFLEPDGRFPNHIPNPEDPEAMDSVCEAVRRHGADLGVIFDTDVDRAGLVGPDGREINRNRLVALAAAVALEDVPGGTIVTDSVTSRGLKAFIEETLGGRHCRFKRGYKNVIDEGIRLNAAGESCPLAIETSGHAALRDNYFLDDGAYLATRLIIRAARLRKEGRTLDSLIDALAEPAEGVELRFPIREPDFAACGNAVIAGLESYARERGWEVADDSREGVRLSFGPADGDGWLLLRLSVHDPVMPLNIESDQAGGCRRIAGLLAGFMTRWEGLDRSALEGYLAGE
ncbi:MAG: phosphomannomutase/phosphoglucomutase [Clostridiales bacterium]|nr:phosphomannomutase/phosphoglucomutase [Clostridiales bacterium]